MSTEPTIEHDQGNELSTPELTVPEEVSATLETAPVETEETAPVETEETTKEVTAEEVVTAAEAGTEEGTTPPETAWEPNYKYKVRDTEHEIEEWARPHIKDEDTRKKFVDLYTRGHGLELAKTERAEVQTKYDNIEQSLGVLNGYVQDYYKNPKAGAHAASQFIDALGLPKQMFLQYALSELKYEQLSPEQRVEVDAERQQQIQLSQMQMQNQQLVQQNEQIATNQRKLELNSALAETNITSVAQEYDTRIGRQGAFYDLVVERGIYHDKVNSQDIPVQQAIQEAMGLIGASIQAGTPVQQPQTGQVGTPPVQTHTQKKPVLPNISGQGTASPVKSVVNSIEDIRKRHAELSARG